MSMKYNLFLAVFFIYLTWLALWTSFSILSLRLMRNMGWFLLRRFADLVSVYTMYILYQLLVKTIPTHFYWLICKKQNFFKVKYWRKDCFFWYQDFDRFWQVFVHYISVRIIVLNSLHNKYPERNKDFSPLQAKGFYKNWEAFFAFCDAILDINNISYEKQYTMDE